MKRPPLLPRHLTSQDGTDDFVPSGFTDGPTGVTATFQYEWVSERTGQTGDWSKFSTPTLWGRYSTDGVGIEFIFRRTTNNVAPSTPTTSNADDATDDFVPTGWSDDLVGVDATDRYEWRSKRTGRHDRGLGEVSRAQTGNQLGRGNTRPD